MWGPALSDRPRVHLCLMFAPAFVVIASRKQSPYKQKRLQNLTIPQAPSNSASG